MAIWIMKCAGDESVVGIVAFGEVGGGKSTLCNTLVGSESGSAFKESAEAEAETLETIGKWGRFDSQKMFVIDTPGMGDANRIDAKHLVDMAKFIKDNKHAQAFIVVLNFNAPRLGESQRKLFELVASMYPNSYWYRHIGVVWSHYYSFLPENKKAEREKRREGFKNFMKTYIMPNISSSELDAIPQCFVDSIDARKSGDPSRESLKYLVAWAAQLKPLSEETRQRMIRNEFGGFNEAMYQLYAITKDEKYLTYAKAVFTNFSQYVGTDWLKLVYTDDFFHTKKRCFFM